MEVYKASAESGWWQEYGLAVNAGIVWPGAPGALKVAALPVKADAASEIDIDIAPGNAYNINVAFAIVAELAYAHV